MGGGSWHAVPRARDTEWAAGAAGSKRRGQRAHRGSCRAWISEVGMEVSSLNCCCYACSGHAAVALRATAAGNGFGVLGVTMLPRRRLHEAPPNFAMGAVLSQP